MSHGLRKESKEILMLILNSKEGYLTTETILDATKHSASALSQILKRLEEKHYIESQSHGIIKEYRLTQVGADYAKALNLNSQAHEVVDKPKQDLSDQVNQTSAFIRLHALGIKIPYIQLMQKAELQDLLQALSLNAKQVAMRNHTDYIFHFEGLSMKLTQSSLIAYTQGYTKPLEAQVPKIEAQALEEMLGKIYKFEQQAREKNAYFKLKRKTYTINNQKDYDYEIIQEHIAITNDEFAKAATEEIDPYVIAYSDINSDKVSMLADKSIKVGKGENSKGVPEFEAVSHRKLPNGKTEAVFNVENVRIFYEAIGKGYYDPFEIQRQMQDIRDTLDLVAQNEATHIPFFQSQTKLNNEMLGKLELFGQQLQNKQQASGTKPADLWQSLKNIFKKR